MAMAMEMTTLLCCRSFSLVATYVAAMAEILSWRRRLRSELGFRQRGPRAAFSIGGRQVRGSPLATSFTTQPWP